MGPFLFENGHENEVEFIQKRSLALQIIFGARTLDDKVDDKIANS